MIKLDGVEIFNLTKKVAEIYDKGTGAPLSFESFGVKTFTDTAKKLDNKYPKVIKLPPSISQLLEGDYTPSKIITVNEPIIGKNYPLWYASSLKGSMLRFGYINGDSRSPSTQLLDDKDIHMQIAGATGHGKSVLLNVLIYALTSEYAPWEVQLSLSDAKIVEFLNIAKNAPTPHMRYIAATSDTDYIVSMLEDLMKEMLMMNKVYANAGVGGIEDFRKKTGLAIPQNIIVADECTAMFENAKSNTRAMKLLEMIIGQFAALGRNTGYHLMLCSQGSVDAIPATTLQNIGVRCALGCKADVSTKIIGNDEASSFYRKKGTVVVNLEAGDGKADTNIIYKVPLLSKDILPDLSREQLAIAKQLGYKSNMVFYDDSALVREREYKTYLSKFTIDKNHILLGEPAFIMHSEENIMKLELTGNDIENICVNSQRLEEQKRIGKMFCKYFEILGDKASHLIAGIDRITSDSIDFSKIAKFADYDNMFFSKNDAIDITNQTIMYRKLMVKIDKDVFTEAAITERSDEYFYQTFEKGSKYDTVVNRSRLLALLRICNDEEFYPWFSTKFAEEIKEKDSNFACTILLKKLLVYYESYGCLDCCVASHNLPHLYCWLIGLQNTYEIGRDGSSAAKKQLKRMMQDGSRLQVRFIIFTKTMEDMTEFRDCFRWYLLSGAPAAEINKIKLQDFYPTVVGSSLIVLGDLYEEDAKKCRKFKKMLFDDEILC